MINIKETTTLAELIREGISFTLTFQGHPKPVVMPDGYDNNGDRVKTPETISDEVFTERLKAFNAAKGPQAVLDLVGRIKSVSEVDQARRAEITRRIEEELADD